MGLGLSEVANLRGCGSDEDQAGVRTGLGEVCVFREEAVAGVDRFRPGGACGVQHAVDAEVAVAGGRPADRDGLVGGGGVQGVAVRIGEHSHGGDAETAERADDAAGGDPAIGDEDAVEHQLGSAGQTIISRGRVVVVAGIVELEVDGDEDDDVHFGRISPYWPGPLTPSSKVRPPACVTGTFMKTLMLWAMSRSFRPYSSWVAIASRKLSRQQCKGRVWWP